MFITYVKNILGGIRPKDKIIQAKPVEFDKIEVLPYDYYTDFDIKKKIDIFI